MKIAVYEVREDEKSELRRIARLLGVELIKTSDIPTTENVAFAKGCQGVSILGQGIIDAKLLDRYAENGIKYLSTRTIGYNHVDLSYAKKVGIKVCNANYAPNGVADFTVMMMLMCLRQYKQAMWRGQVNDFSLEGLQGKEMRELTIGVMGTGRIGKQVMKNLTGFGCKLLAYDIQEDEEVRSMATYVNPETLYKKSDVITLHMPLVDDTYHIINRDTIHQMKDGVILINCARGELTDIDALVEGIESEKLGALGMDTVEGEEGIIHNDHRVDILANRNWFYLHQFRNVVMTQHMAFYTDAAVKSMVDCGIGGIVQMSQGKYCATKL